MRDPRYDNHSQPDREPLVQYEDLEQATGFTQISNAVLRCYPELSDGEKMTYAVLKSFAYVGPETFVGEETLARARDVTVSTISRHIQRLVEVGLVKVRRRGQGKTNIWIITRIPRNKLEEYIEQWRPNLTVHRRKKDPPQNAQTRTSQDSQIKTSQNPQVKNAQDPQAEEEQPEEDEQEPQGRSNRPGNGSSSRRKDISTTTTSADGNEADSLLAGIVENLRGSQAQFSTAVESVENLASLAAEYFRVPDQERSITGYLRQYDKDIVKSSLATVAARLEQGEPIRKPVAYFYTVVRVAQAEHDAAAGQTQRDDSERRIIARNWARSLMREWPLDQVRAILTDTYHSEQFVQEILEEIDEAAQ
ncbi:MAG: ArsR/SmtB family transcription factor [Armatimonadota bacterium]|jgi:DNA-binding MarR family transcriptional regulator